MASIKPELNSIMTQIDCGQVPVLNTQSEYNEASRAYMLLQEAMRKGRCIECLHRKGTRCQEYNQEIPTEYICAVTECDKYEPDIPF